MNEIQVKTRKDSYVIDDGNIVKIIKVKPGETIEVVPGFTITNPVEVTGTIKKVVQ